MEGKYLVGGLCKMILVTRKYKKKNYRLKGSTCRRNGKQTAPENKAASSTSCKVVKIVQRCICVEAFVWRAASPKPTQIKARLENIIRGIYWKNMDRRTCKSQMQRRKGQIKSQRPDKGVKAGYKGAKVRYKSAKAK